MKESKILKSLSYILLPILLGLLIVSVIYIGVKENSYYNEEEYFKSDSFVSAYMSNLSLATQKLIYNNSHYRYIQDGEMEIFFVNDLERYNIINTKENAILIIYKNKALTNVELTSQTNTIEGIKQYIVQNEKAKTVNIINGEIHTSSETMLSKGLYYLDDFKISYFTIEEDDEYEEYQKVYIDTTIEDYQIYSSYLEEFAENSEPVVMKNLLTKLSIDEQETYFLIPVTATLIILIITYLIIAIGHKKGTNEITLNDFDKIPLEIIIFISMMIGCIPFIGLSGITDNYNLIVSIIITAYIIIYALVALTLHTTIKRIKAKKLLKTTITGNIIIFIEKCFEKTLTKIKGIYKTLTGSSGVIGRTLFRFVILGIIALLILMMFGYSALTVLLEGILIVVVICNRAKTVISYSKIENKLKEMYEGNNQNELDENELSPEFHNTVKYLNDISNGFENAIQDRMKSERLKAELITNVSHDIKTPLTSIINYVDLLKQENIENDKVKEYIGILDNKSQRLKKLTEDLIEASKVSTGNVSLKLEKINIVELIKQDAGEFDDKFEKKGLKTIIDSKETEIYINADSRYMYRIIENLFSNISKYALENSRVYIDISKNEKQVVLEIKNISKDSLNISAEELMQRFVRGDKSRTTEGSGLGISIAQNLTEMQGGEFTLKLDGDLFKVELKFDTI